MTEAIWVAIITIAGIVVGSGITALVTYLNNKSQFEHERKENQIARLIEKRASYLNPISEHLQSMTESTHYLEKTLRDLVFLCGGDTIAWSYPNSSFFLDEMAKSVRALSKSMDGIEMLRVKNTDSRLAGFIANTLALGVQVSKEISELNGMRIKHGKGDTGAEPNKDISFKCVYAFEVTTDFFASIRQCNKRIEEILSGILEST